jgi:predicted HTH transcriptional regulator
MKLPLVPDKIDGWNIRKLNELLKIINVESETLEFKGRNFGSLADTFCAMANTSGGYIVLGIEQDKSKNKFIKNGFDKGKDEENNGQKIGNYMYEVEPTPEVITRNLYDKNNKFYTVLQIKSEDTKKPYFTRNGYRCYTRVSNGSKPAGRSVILNLAMTKMVSREESHSHTEYLTKIYERLTGLRYYSRYEFIFLEVPDD